MPKLKLLDESGKEFRSFDVLSDDKTGSLKHVLFKYYASMAEAERCLVRKEMGFVENTDGAWLVFRSGIDGRLFHVKMED